MNSSHSLPITAHYFTHHKSGDALPSLSHSPTSNSPRPSHDLAIELASLSRTSPNHTTTELPTPTTAGDRPAPSDRNVFLYRVALYALMFVEGWNDATTGPLLPVIQKRFGISFTIVSLLFISSAAGFGLGAVLNIYLTDRFGLGKIICACSVLQMVAYSMIAPAAAFPLMCLGYAFNGFTMALHNAQCNMFTVVLPGNPSSSMGLLHGFYGIGAMSAPLMATQFAQLRHWSYFYLISMGLAMCTFTLSLFVFRLKRMEDLVPQTSTDETPLVQGNKYKHIMRQKQVHLLAAFTLIYVGAEVTIGGWIVTFLDELRGGGPSAGYVSSGFFGGITLGRFILWPITDRIGKTRAIYVYGVLAVGLELIVWQVPDLIANAVAVALVGLVLGPLYPIVMNVAAEVLPRWILAGSIGYVASLGQMGSALFPFLTGLLATSHGVGVLQPLVIGLLVLMMVNWIVFLLNSGRRTD